MNALLYACTCWWKRYLTKVFNNQVASILNLDKLAQNIMQFSRCNSKDWIIWGLRFLWGRRRDIISILFFDELQNRTACINVNMSVEITGIVKKPETNMVFMVFYESWDFFLPFSFFFFSPNNGQVFKSILSLFCFALLRMMEVVPTFHMSVFAWSWKTGKGGPCSVVEECSRWMANKSFSQVHNHYLY